MRLEARALVRAPVEIVWAALTDWERQASWMPDVEWVRLESREREAGARLRIRTKVFGVPAVTDVIEVSEWRPPTRVAVRHAGLVRGTGEWTVSPIGPDATAFVWVEDLRLPPPVVGEIALRVYSPWQRLMLRESIRRFRRLVER